ncbi:hypothetical protein F2Q69_00016284 [Brassica cretica]|uniref:Uncharacterized protein n=1 Tax=Brassica cretica TaxID=69181 RepID=A0A8S9R4Z4_BRACR|nr:hypothetical protein F2Q69_00016284 [Brassica cretica]
MGQILKLKIALLRPRSALEISSKRGFPASRIIPWARSGSGSASPGRAFPEPEGLVPAFCDRDEQFVSGWRRTRKHDNCPPRL